VNEQPSGVPCNAERAAVFWEGRELKLSGGIGLRGSARMDDSRPGSLRQPDLPSESGILGTRLGLEGADSFTLLADLHAWSRLQGLFDESSRPSLRGSCAMPMNLRKAGGSNPVPT